MDELERARRRLISGAHLPVEQREDATVILVVLLGIDEAEIRRHSDALEEAQAFDPTFKPIILTDSEHTRPLRTARFLVETVMLEAEWRRLGLIDDYAAYRAKRIQGANQRYGATRELRPGPTGDLDLTNLNGGT